MSEKIKDSQSPLLAETCGGCTGISPLSRSQAHELLKQIPGWALENRGIQKEFGFANFLKALAFVNRVGEIAEKEGHHPDIFLHDYKKVKISLWTHTVSDLTQNDFIVAAKINEL